MTKVDRGRGHGCLWTSVWTACRAQTVEKKTAFAGRCNSEIRGGAPMALKGLDQVVSHAAGAGELFVIQSRSRSSSTCIASSSSDVDFTWRTCWPTAAWVVQTD